MASATLSDSTIVGTLLESKAGVAVPPGAGDWLSRFDQVYREADGQLEKVPWAHTKPCPSMISWLNAEAPSLVRCGARAAVVGCGLGEDAAALVERGYDAVAFDCSPTAVSWAKRRHPEHAEIFVQGDLFNLPSRLRHRFDLVIEVHTLQSLPPAYRPALAAGMASLLSPRGGILLAVTRGRDPGVSLDSIDGPPFPFTASELSALMEANELAPVRPLDEFLDDSESPVRRIRGAFKRF
ncbi:MAG: methyltransferase domain-containing protein [Phycisphaerae bacterium]|nr:methyltransferase domain-containing protein [Phycisphaerae bacterium]